MNALVKAPGSVRDKVVFISASPCVMCAKLMINSGVSHVFYRKPYRDPSGIEVLGQGGVVPALYDRWGGGGRWAGTRGSAGGPKWGRLPPTPSPGWGATRPLPVVAAPRAARAGGGAAARPGARRSCW